MSNPPGAVEMAASPAAPPAALDTITWSAPPPRIAERAVPRWDPDDAAFWAASGRRIAYRNLAISIPALLLAFAVWMVWSVVAVNLPRVGFAFSTQQLFWLAAVPALSGAGLRVFYAFIPAIFGGRRWTALSTASLLIPALGIGIAVQNPATPYWTMLLLALLCGLGGGNFASSIANISFFFPASQKGLALGLNAGLGNLGISIMQLLVPLAITVSVFGVLGGSPQTTTDGMELWLQNASLIWVPFIAICAVAAWLGMDDLATARAPLREQTVIFRRRHTWIMSWLHIGTFGSFIGYTAGFPLLIRTHFPDVDALSYAFLGPLAGALIRPLGGWLADRLGGARVTLAVFVAMAAVVLGVVGFLPHGEYGGNFGGFLALFLVLFALAGIGNGSTFRMIAVIFPAQRRAEAAAMGPQAVAEAARRGMRESSAALGLASAIGAFGGFFIPGGYGWSIGATGCSSSALLAFLVFYLTCIGLTWWCYLRSGASVRC
jgi:MFS transporter, NNP family, nitrate/nitrite transporter